MNNDSTKKTLLVAVSLCLVCSVLVSSISVSLKPIQAKNKALDFKKNLLLSAGILQDPSAGREEVESIFANIETKLIELSTGEEVDAASVGLELETFSLRKVLSKDETRDAIPKEQDKADIKFRPKYTKIYRYKGTLILPVHGTGLWSVMWGFMAIDESDYNTIKGLGFYEHGETPGLGGEVDNPNWKKLWIGKKIYGPNGELKIELIKGSVSSSTAEAEYKVDGLSGATITSVGVTNLVRYWMGPNGYGPFLDKMRSAR